MNHAAFALGLGLFLATSGFSQSPGDKLWEFNVGDSVFSSPAVAPDGTICVGSANGKLYGLHPNGTHRWEYSAGAGFSSSPAIAADGTIYCGSDDTKLYALNSDGLLKWSVPTGFAVFSSPAIGADGMIYFGSGDGRFFAVRPDGSTYWTFTTGGRVESSPAVGADGTIYFGSDDFNFYALNPDGTKRWSFATTNFIRSGPAIGTDGIIYFGSFDQNLYALNPDGTKRWSFATTAPVQSSPALGPDGTIYVGAVSPDNRLHAVNPDGTKRWEFVTGNSVVGSPAVGGDGGIYFGSADGQFYALNSDGTKRWQFAGGGRFFSSPVLSTNNVIYVGGGSDNRKAYALAGGGGPAVSPWPMFRRELRHNGRVQPELVVLAQPASRAVEVGDPVVLSFSVTGQTPVTYVWRHDGQVLTNETNATLRLAAAQLTDSGQYTVAATNQLGGLVSDPAVLSVKPRGTPLVLVNGQSGLEFSFTNLTSVLVTMKSSFTNAAIYYTVDGSPPSFNATPYGGSFAVTHSVVLRAVAYSATFEKAETDSLPIHLWTLHSLTATTAGGGTLALDPPGGVYRNDQFVTVTAMPADGWMFLSWLGDAAGTNPVLSVALTRNQEVEAVFGTSIATSTNGSGSIRLNPELTLFPYGSVVQVGAVPAAGNYFALWGGGSLMGNTNPQPFVVTNAGVKVAALFDALADGQVSLAVLAHGPGAVAVVPRANVYTNGQVVLIAAAPLGSQQFLGWSGDATGTNNPLSVTLDRSKVISAEFAPAVRFTSPPVLTGGTLALELSGLPAELYRLDASTNLVDWLTLTNFLRYDGVFRYDDADAGSLGRRFYRAVGP